MRLLRALLGLALALVVQATLGRAWPGGHRYVDALIVPVVWYGIHGTQRSAMLVGFAAGLLHDVWFEVPIGFHGFKWTLVGWALGVAATRLDLSPPGGRFAAGVAAWLADSLLDPLLRRLVDLQPLVRTPGQILVQALLTGLLLLVTGSILDRIRSREPLQRYVL